MAGVNHRAWDEATEVAIDCGTHTLGRLLEREVVVEHAIPGGDDLEVLLDEQDLDRRRTPA